MDFIIESKWAGGGGGGGGTRWSLCRVACVQQSGIINIAPCEGLWQLGRRRVCLSPFLPLSLPLPHERPAGGNVVAFI